MYEFIKRLNNQLKDKTIENIVLINKRTFMFLFANKEEKLIVSLNHLNPSIYFVDKIPFFTSFESSLLDLLRKEIKGSIVFKIEEYNESSYLKMSFLNSNKYLLFKLVAYKPNLYLKENDSLIAYFYKDENDCSSNKEKLSPLKNLNDEEKKKHFENEIAIREKEKYAYFITFLKGKINRVNKKFKNILDDKNKAFENLKYADYGNEIYCLNLNLKAHYKEIEIDGKILELDESKRLKENIDHFFKIAKKAKETIRLSDENIRRAQIELDNYQSLLNKFELATSEKEKEQIILESNFAKKKCEIKETPYNKPYKINFNGTIIYFGKNASQNDYLSFVKKLDREYSWLHIKNISGSHIVIANRKATDKEIQLAGELACLLSKVNDGIISITKKKNVRRGKNLGEAILKNYSSYKINHISEETKNIYLTAVRDD